MNVHLVKWGRVGFCMQTCSLSTPRIKGVGRGRVVVERGGGDASGAELRIPFGRRRSAGAGGGRGRRRLPFGGAQSRGRRSAAGPRERPPGKGAPCAGLRARTATACPGVSAGAMRALCLDPRSPLTRKPVTRYVACKLLRKKHLSPNLTKLRMQGKNEMYLNKGTRCKLAVSQAGIDPCIDLSSNVSSQ